MRLSIMTLIAATATFAATGGCGDDAKRPLNQPCENSSQCESGLCLAGQCLDPAGDEDLDSIVNGLEAQFTTDPFNNDSDGDSKLDLDEVGATDAPTDTDGDGKIDAVESSIADYDNDCIPDEVDANDLFSDEASDANPEACGTGEAVDPPAPPTTPVAGRSCSGTWTSLDNTCARPMADMLRCFDAQGDCAIEGEGEEANALVFENGARLNFTELDGGVMSVDFVNAAGTSCGTSLSSEDSDAFQLITAGQTFDGVTDETSDVTTVTCPDGTEIALSDADNAAMQGCFGTEDCLDLSSFTDCDGPNGCPVGTPCERDSDCNSGALGCCEITPGVDICIQPELCVPVSSQ